MLKRIVNCLLVVCLLASFVYAADPPEQQGGGSDESCLTSTAPENPYLTFLSVYLQIVLGKQL